MCQPPISVIIPVLGEQLRINGVIDHLSQVAPDCEIIVVDGDPAGTTLAIITSTRVIRLAAPRGRGSQLSAGAGRATGSILLMLHADTRLPANALSSLRTAVAGNADWGAFRLGIAGQGMAFRIIERSVDLRCKVFSLPYGDQAIFATRKALDAAGGIPAIPLMEDVELALRLKRAGQRFRLLDEHVSTSPRRWRKDGILRRTVCNWWLLLRYLAGADARDLERKYR
jgi:rSAM/selenodomain-associated transferase 2